MASRKHHHHHKHHSPKDDQKMQNGSQNFGVIAMKDAEDSQNADD